MSEYNPIRRVDGASIKCPSGYKYILLDISASDAGDTEAGTMEKKRIGQKVKLELEWNGLRTSELTCIMKTFNPQYFNVEYLDPLDGGYVTREFYAGDREAPAYNTRNGLWTLDFNIISRKII